MKKFRYDFLSDKWIDLKLSNIIPILKRYKIPEIKNIVKLSGGVVNLNFKISTTGEQHYVFRIYRYKSKFNIETELNLIDFLRQKKIPTPHYLKDKFGERIQKLNSNYGVLFEFVNGVKLKEENISPLHVQKVGILLGNLHLSTNNFFQGQDRWRGDIKEIKVLYQKRRKEIKLAFPLLYQRVKSYLDILLEMEEDFILPEGLVHSDMRIDNFIFSKQGEILALLDFDNFYYGYLLTDIATAIYFFCFEKEKLNKEKMENLISSYQNYRHLSEQERKLIIRFLRFVALKHILYGCLICVEGNPNFGENFALQGIRRFKSLIEINSANNR